MTKFAADRSADAGATSSPLDSEVVRTSITEIVIGGELDISTVIEALDHLAYDCRRDESTRKAAQEVLARIGAVMRSDGIFRLRGSESCSCPDIDVSHLGEVRWSHTRKGLDPACPVHGSINLGRSASGGGDNR